MENINEGNSNNQAMEFQILGIKSSWRAPIVFGLLALSILLNFFLVHKILGIQKEISEMQEKMYERVITEIKPKVQRINDNIDATNERLQVIEQKEKEGGND